MSDLADKAREALAQLDDLVRQSIQWPYEEEGRLDLYRPDSYGDYLARLRTFDRAACWTPRPLALERTAMARYGWAALAAPADSAADSAYSLRNLAKCGVCNQIEYWPWLEDVHPEAAQTLIAEHLPRLQSAHAASCPWRVHGPCLPSITNPLSSPLWQGRLRAMARKNEQPLIRQGWLIDDAGYQCLLGCSAGSNDPTHWWWCGLNGQNPKEIKTK